MATPIDLGPLNQHEEYAWVATAILAHVHLGVRLTPKSHSLIEDIQKEPEAFLQVLKSISQENAFGFVEMSAHEAKRVKEFALGEA